MTFWPLTNSDYPTNQTFYQFHDLDTDFDLHRITSGFHGAFATGVACQQGTLTLPNTWFRPPFWDLLMLQLLRPNSSSLPCLYSTFHIEYLLVLFRFCLLNKKTVKGGVEDSFCNILMTGWMDRLRNVTSRTFQSYIWRHIMCRRTEKDACPTVGLPRHRHFRRVL